MKTYETDTRVSDIKIKPEKQNVKHERVEKQETDRHANDLRWGSDWLVGLL